MNKFGKKFSLLLTLTLLVLISATPLIQANAINSSTDDGAELWQDVPLTNDQIKATWPNLPTPKQLYENEGGLVIDLRYCGKQVSSMDEALPDPNSPTVFDVTSIIVNCTTTVPDYLHGGLDVNSPHIWLQYNSSIWIQVPSKYLQTTITSKETKQQTETWAVGMYANPQQIAGSYDVWGVCTFGQWNSETFGTSGSYVGTNVLTVCSNNMGYQFAMQLNPVGRAVVYNIWDLSMVYITDANTGQLYNMYIRYDTSSGWQGWWNQTLYWTYTADTSTRVRTGNQVNVVVESNDFIANHFSGFYTNIGGIQSGYNLCATVYLFNGNWKPLVSGDYAPAGYTYLGGQSLNGVTIGDQAPPSNWSDLNIGQTTSYRGRFTVGVGRPQRVYGYTLWTYGTI